MADTSDSLTGLEQLTLIDEAKQATQSDEPALLEAAAALLNAYGEPFSSITDAQQPAASSLDPALRQALQDSNRATVLKLEETVMAFLSDSSQNLLDFPASTSNYQRLLEHKVAQHHQLQTSTVFENGQPRVEAKRPPIKLNPEQPSTASNNSSQQVQRLADIDVAKIKIEPKALVRRPPSANGMHHHQHGSSSNNSGPYGSQHQHDSQQQQRKKSHKEREAEYNEARERIIGKSLTTHSNSSGNLTAAAATGAGSSGNLAGMTNRPASAGASSGAAALSGYLAAVPPNIGNRGFNIVNPGRGMGRGGGSASRGSGSGSFSGATAQPEPSTTEAPGAVTPQQVAGAQQQGSAATGGRGTPGPKAVYRDRERDVQDPDYRRGVDRYQQRFDPGYGAGSQPGVMYNVPSYGSEFPALVANSSGNNWQSLESNNSSNGNAAAGSRHQQRHQQHLASGNSRNGYGSRPSPPHHHQQQGYNQQAQQQGYGQYPGYGAVYPGAYPASGDPGAAATMYGHMAGYGYPSPTGYGNPAPQWGDQAAAAAAAAAGYDGYQGYGGYGTPAGYGPGYGTGHGGYGNMQWGGYGDSYNGRYYSGYNAGAYSGYDSRQQQQQQEGVQGAKGSAAGSRNSASAAPADATGGKADNAAQANQ